MTAHDIPSEVATPQDDYWADVVEYLREKGVVGEDEHVTQATVELHGNHGMEFTIEETRGSYK